MFLGWLYKLKVKNAAELKELLSEAEYESFKKADEAQHWNEKRDVITSEAQLSFSLFEGVCHSCAQSKTLMYYVEERRLISYI